MNTEVKQKWVTALRSGEYQQGKGTLCKEGKFCCLGVLTDLFIKEHPEYEWIKLANVGHFKEPEEEYGSIYNFLPPVVQNWANLDSYNPFVVYKEQLTGLVALNDGHKKEQKSFVELADLIEEQL